MPPAKRDSYRDALRPLLLAALDSPGLLSPEQFKIARFSLDMKLRVHLLDPDIAALEDYLIDHSSLPGRRANLELIGAFADVVAALCSAPDVSLNRSYVSMEWLLMELLNRYPPDVFGSDPDSPLQMPQLCAMVALGEWAVAFRHIEFGAAALLGQAGSPLWRVREAVAMGVQRMLAAQWNSVIRRLNRRAIDATAWEWRAIVAGVAEPGLLTDLARALDALDLHSAALAYLRRLSPDARRGDPARVLRQALGYSISVVTAAAPAVGFAQMHAWAAWDDPDITRILRENTTKKRLEAWPDRLDALRAVLADT